MELKLIAYLGWSTELAARSNSSLAETKEDIVVVRLGNTEIARLPITAEPSRAGHGDDSTFFESEERRIIEETIAPYLTEIFEA